MRVQGVIDTSIVIATYGSEDWEDLAYARAFPSANRQGAREVIVFHEREGTLASCRNRAAADAEEDWLCFLDADDELGDGYLDAMAKAERRQLEHDPATLERTENGLLVPAVSFTDFARGTSTVPAIPNGGGSRPLLDINYAVIGTLVPRRLFLEVGGFRELPALEDWDLWLRCEEAGAKLVQVRDAVYRAWVRPSSRNADQSLYTTLRSESLARRSAIRGKRDPDAPGSKRDDHGDPRR